MKRLFKMLSLLSILLILGSCSTSKSIDVSTVKGFEQVVTFIDANITNYPIQFVYVTGGKYLNEPFFTNEQINIETGVNYTITWTYADNLDGGQWKTASVTTIFNFSRIALRYKLGAGASTFSPAQ